ncbi:pectate lyase family protein [Pseudoclavibacter terrae]|uniref:Depolymerase 2 capsule K5-specific C-terminal domain-containing protein n=1 Tax=Pseudoclavibacter terrae TaxID=1530195 RepID=A0A7J5B600_9MICO|nr:hypothetical protein [Pseudoclavibacter terrae]KAB1639131.1 hypothetical protein F8O03_01950 [Pseudoclavibacter terrae]
MPQSIHGRRSVVVGGAGAVGAALAGMFASPTNAVADAQGHPLHNRAPTVLTAAEQTTIDKIAVVAEARRFSGIDPTGASDSTTGLQAAMDATPDGGTLLIPAGTYQVSVALAPKSGKSITVSGYGAKLIATTTKSIISLRGTYDETVGVSSAADTAVSFPTGQSVPTTVIKLAKTMSWKAGDVIKIVADDLIGGSRPGSRRIGEFGVVYSVSGSTVTLAGRLRETYQTNVRAARITRQTINVLGLELECIASRLTQTSNEALLAFSRLLNPRVQDVRVTQSSNRVVSLNSCFGYLVENVDVGYARDASGESALGYGVADNCCSFGRVVGGTFRHVRHAYTDDTPEVPANNSDLTYYGRTYGTVLLGVESFMTTSAGFSTHHSSEGVTFSACRTTGSVPAGGTPAGFELRGRRHRITDCTAHQSVNGISIRTESGGGESWGHHISNFKAERMSGAAIVVSVNQSGHPNQNTRDSQLNAIVDGLVATDCVRMLFTENAVVNISNATYIAPEGVADGLYEGFFARNSQTLARNIVLDYTYNKAGKPRPFITGSTTGRDPGRQNTNITDLDVRITPSAAARAYFVFGGTENRVNARQVRLQYPFPSTPGEAHANSSWEWEVDYSDGVVGTDLSSGYFSVKAVLLASSLANIVRSSDKTVVVHVLGESKSVSISSLPKGRRRGQHWVFMQMTTGTTTFVHGTAARTSLKSAGNRALTKGRRLELVWDGTLWQEMIHF